MSFQTFIGATLVDAGRLASCNPSTRGERIMTKWLMCLALCMFALLAYTSSSHATPLLDPSTLQIGPGSTLDPVQIGSSGTVTVTNVSSGASDLNVPWLVILGIPNTTSTTATIT